MDRKKLKGGILVGAGAACYGLLATFVRLAYNENYTLADVTVSQFTWGIAGLLIINLLFVRKGQNRKKTTVGTSKNPVAGLLLFGTSLGLTSTFYYISVQYIPVSLAIVMLMQTVWLGVVVEAIFFRQRPSVFKIIAVLLILVGTVLSTDVINSNATLDVRGIFWGFLAAASYTVTVFTNNRIGLELHPFRRTLWMLCGGFVVVLIVSSTAIADGLHWSIFTNYGILLALFGTILPPILFNLGMPLTGMGLGAVLSALEIPVSVLMAHFFLHEKVNLLQWSGIALIILMVILINLPAKKEEAG